MALALGIALSLWGTQIQQQRQQAAGAEAFDRLTERTHAGLIERLEAGELLARSVQTLFLTSQNVSADEFSHIYANLHPRELVPGLQALAYAVRIPDPRGDRYVTEMVQPLTGNERIVGLLVNSQPPNLAAVLASRDTDRPVLSAPFRLAQATNADAVVDGITLRLPIYTPGMPPLTLEERRQRMQGSLALSFRVRQLIESAIPAEVSESLHIKISDISHGSPVLMFDSSPGQHPSSVDHDYSYEARHELVYGGRTWQIAMHSVDHAAPTAEWTDSLLLPGLLASLLLAMLVASVAGTRRRALELALSMSRRYRESEERFRALNELLPALVLLARSEDGRITYANHASRARLGDQVCEMALPMLFEDLDLRAALAAQDTVGCSNVEAVLRTTNDDRFWAVLSITRVELNGQDKLLMVATDISEQRQLTELLSYQATHDALTELYNRREFERRIERALVGIAAGSPPAALLYIDLDQFKLINDTSGHIAGDQLLTQLAIVMREQLRGGDVLARLGGDEFGVLATNVHDQAGAHLVAERLRERIDGYVFVWEQRTYTVSASIGAVMIEGIDSSLKDLLAQADTACYMAKENGRNRVHFFSSHDDDTTRRQSEMEWANRLRWAVEEQRLLLNYQEVWPLTTVVGGPHVELLLRFRDEQGKIVVPGAFMPAAERYGLMPMIDRWVIETALANFDNLHPTGVALQMATINLSGASIEDESFALLILEWIGRYGVDPTRVCFEITETVAVRNMSQVIRFIQHLREAGCLIALDDFGAGMSSFGYLKNLPVDIIKIDGSFIRDLITDPMSQAIVRAVTDIGHQRGLKVIAEWVTSEEIVDALVELGVDFAQGFALHRPEPVPFHRNLPD